MNTTKMEKVITKNGIEYAFANVKKNECGEYEVRVYVNGKYIEDMTYYTDDREDAIETRQAIIDFCKTK